MYQVRCDGQVIYDLRDEELKIITPKLSTEVNKVGTFDFIIPPQNPCYDLIKKLKSIITIYQDNEEIWRGRVLNDKLDFYNRKQVECEGELAFLLDSIQRPYSFQGSPNDLFKQLINTHNSQVEETKRFQIRNVDVPDNNNYINRENSNYSNTWDAINEKLIDTNSGYLETGKLADGNRYIDYLSEYSHVNSQIIQFGENLLDITQYAKGENIKTAIIPLGAKKEETEERLTISSVNNNKDYIYDEIAVKLFGWIWGTVEFEDVTLAENLKTKGQKYLESVINESVTIELTAVDLHHLNCDIEKFKKGDLVRVISIPHKIDKYFLVSKLELNLDDPKSSNLVLGQTFTTFTQSQTKESKSIKQSIIVANNESSKTQKEITALKEDVKEHSNVIVKIPEKYVDTETFEQHKKEIEKDISKAYKMGGSVQSLTELEQMKNKKIGQVFLVKETGTYYAYTSDGLERLSQDLSIYMKTQEAESKYTYKSDFEQLVARVVNLENR